MAVVTINSNLLSAGVLRGLSRALQDLGKSQERLSSGLRINRASDDAAGLSIASSLNVDTRVFNQGVRNLNDGISLLNIAEGALLELSNIVTRQKELASQAANGVYSLKQRRALNDEANALVDEFNRIINTTKFNGEDILSSVREELRLQAGYGTQGGLTFSLASSLAQTKGTGSFDDGSGKNEVTELTFGAASTLDGSKYFRIYAAGYEYIVGFNIDWFGFDPWLETLDGDLLIVNLNSGDSADQVAQKIGASLEATGNFSVETSSGGVLTLTATNSGDLTDAVDEGGTGASIEILTQGTPGGHVELDLGANTTSVAVGDLNNDGCADLATAELLSNTVSIRLGSGDGSFGGIITYSSGYNASSIMLADMNNDGHLDMIYGSESLVSVRLGDGTGGFGDSLDVAASSSTFQVADLNNDSIQDLVVGKSTAEIYLGRGDGSFAISGAEAEITRLAFSDGNTIVAGSYFYIYSPDRHYVWFKKDGAGSDPSEWPGELGTGIEVDISAADSAETIASKVKTALESAGVFSVSNQGGGILTVTNLLEGSAANATSIVGVTATVLQQGTNGNAGSFAMSTDNIDLADLNGDGILDLLGGNLDQAAIYFRFGNGDGTFGSKQAIELTMDQWDTTAADMNNDGLDDLVYYNSGEGLSVRLSRGDGTFEQAIAHNPGMTGARWIEAADINGDGYNDLVFGDSLGSSDLRTMLGNGDGTLQSLSSNYYMGTLPRGHLLADVNNDGVSDLLAIQDQTLHIRYAATEERTSMGYLNIASQASARKAMDELDSYLLHVEAELAAIGAAQSRISTAVSVLSTSAENFTAAESQIRDIDVAKEAADLVRNKIIQDTAASLLSQANQVPANLLGTFLNF